MCHHESIDETATEAEAEDEEDARADEQEVIVGLA